MENKRDAIFNPLLQEWRDFNLLTPSSEDERHARNPSNHSKDLPLIHNGTKGAAAAGETNEGQKERNQPI